MRWKDVSPLDAKNLLAQDPNLLVLDVRTPPEYEAYHIEGANLIPVQVIDQHFHQLDPARSWLVVCEHGMRSEAACEFLTQQGFTNLTNLQGGMAAWVGANLPTASGFPQSTQAKPKGGCGHHCGCASGESEAEAAPVGEKAAKKGWLRSLFGG